MPNINFPANPTQGQEYVFNKFKYVFNGNRWQSARNDSSSDLDNFIKDLGAPDSKVLVAGVEAKDFIDQKDGIPATAVIWFPSRDANHEGYIPADGQLLSRALYPSLWEAVRDNKVPVTTEDAWQAAVSNRGGYTAGDGTTTFRVPDYNGKSSNAIGAAFLRGDGVNSGLPGEIQGDTIRNITASIGYLTADQGVVSPRSTTGAFTPHNSGTTNLSGGGVGAIVDSAYGITFDASRVVPTANENRPVNVTGVWMIKAFSYVENEGVVDAGHLATALADAEAKIAVSEAKIAELEKYPKVVKMSDIFDGTSVWGANDLEFNVVEHKDYYHIQGIFRTVDGGGGGGRIGSFKRNVKFSYTPCGVSQAPSTVNTYAYLQRGWTSGTEYGKEIDLVSNFTGSSWVMVSFMAVKQS